MKKLKSLKKHNEEIRELKKAAKKNGIACPECGKELLDGLPYPCRGNEDFSTIVYCEFCKYRGGRL